MAFQILKLRYGACRRCEQAGARDPEVEEVEARVRAIQTACAEGLRLPPGAAGGPPPEQISLVFRYPLLLQSHMEFDAYS